MINRWKCSEFKTKHKQILSEYGGKVEFPQNLFVLYMKNN